MKSCLTKTCHRFFTNLANPTRLAAIQQLMRKPQSVNELAAALGQEQSMISHNLKSLLQCSIVTKQRVGKQSIYSVNRETLDPILAAIENHIQKYCHTGEKCLKEANV